MRRRTRISAHSHSRATQDSPTTLPSQWPGSAWAAFASGDLRTAEELERRALAAAEAARSPWAAAHARVRLARVLVAAGAADTAEQLYRDVLEWSDTLPAARSSRESVRARRRPGAAARAGLDDLGQPQGTAALPARAESALTP